MIIIWLTFVIHFTEYTGPYLHIDLKITVGEDFLTEMSVISRDARSSANFIIVSNVICLIFISFVLAIIGS